MTNLLRAGFSGPIIPVNPKAAAVHGIMAYKDVASLPVTPDLAVIATPPDVIPALVTELGSRGTRAAVILTAGFAEGEVAAGKERSAAASGGRAPASPAHRRSQLPRHCGARYRAECDLCAGEPCCPAISRS